MNLSVGKTFKKLRTSQNITLKSAVKNIDQLSSSRLSHWENDESNIPLSKLDQLLDNIHVLPNEFAHLIGQRYVNQVSVKVQDAFILNDIDELHSLAKRQLEKYKQVKDTAELFLCSLTCNFYYQKTKIDIFPANLKEEITNVLSSTSLWNHYHITTFGNVTYLLPAVKIYKISLKLINSFSHIEACGMENHIFALIALLNADIALLLKDLNLAEKLFKKINQLEFHNFDYYSPIYMSIIKYLINYQKTKNSKYIKLALDIVDLCLKINKKEAANEFWDLIFQVQQIS
ncbi:XRE family transcriptional regulator [Lactobacillus mulieris]|uniref:Rgg/GadR/MutR family transcriptional regulator n=1 Tax=Lactobacillus mulieris TaxID=2508708 RepID=UPI0014331E5A|nr:Rgg/GadR/MutR family transcriptional regulator [Lactobacillus mulieris]MCF1783150.1 XRE family transcriptional regulator [Lactobacillus mulieris]MDK6802899.1 XRE family transcriptional regulator [Lactobacillus mulieris]MDK8382015.1 XRE family transcriptional regulator [Lactobacillus mulieris]MDT9620478.1 XRE family transcriptional regulator [Lactobacillus mulieris]NKC41266.1 XRE family transcriptional regulator [Lactobacillus mulieris]